MNSVIMGSSNVVAKLPLANEVLNLIIELMAVIGVVPYVAVIATKLILVSLYPFLPYREGFSEVYPSFAGLKYLSHVCIQLIVEGVSCQWGY